MASATSSATSHLNVNSAKQILQQGGFSHVSNLTQNANGTITGSAMQGSSSMQVTVDGNGSISASMK
jgi:hypothetical protein